jgi:hypothetical protein
MSFLLKNLISRVVASRNLVISNQIRNISLSPHYRCAEVKETEEKPAVTDEKDRTKIIPVVSYSHFVIFYQFKY